MPRFAANISLLFTELPFLDRFDAAADAGFTAIEILFPYDFPVKDIKRALLRNGQELVLFNAPPPNYTDGERGFGAIPGGEDRFKYDIKRALRYARELDAGMIHVMAGYTKHEDAEPTFINNLKWAADQAPEQQFTIEPLNPVAQPGYFLDDYALATRILDAVNRPNVGLQYDTYHAHMIHGDALTVWDDYKHRSVHVQIGAAPDRSEPGRGPTDFSEFFSAIDASGYTGWVSAEYNPSTARTEDSLHWLQ